MRKAILAYIPVLHEGYRSLFARHSDARELYLFGNEVIAEFDHLRKDIRRIDPELIKRSIEAWDIFDRVHVFSPSMELQDICLIISDDDITSKLVSKYLSHLLIETDTIFLRWDKKTSITPLHVSPDVLVSTHEFDRTMIELAIDEGKKSPDWWRRIGSIAVKNRRIILKAHNEYALGDQIAYEHGDPRGNFTSGVHLESSLAIHAEARMIAEAAREGIPLKGVDVYCDTFPCPPCAKQLAYAGIRRLYYRNGYKVLDGEDILRARGVEIVYVKENETTTA